MGQVLNDKLADEMFEEKRKLGELEKGDIEFKEKKKKEFSQNFQSSDIVTVVSNFRNKQPFFYDETGLFWFWNFEDNKWEIWDDTDVLLAICKNLQVGNNIVNSGVKNSYLEAFKIVGRNNIPKKPDNNWIQFKDCVYDLDLDITFPVSYEYFFCNPIPHNLGKSEELDKIDCLLNTWVNENYVNTLYEILAYCLIADYPIHRLFCFYGSGSNGKSCFLRIISKLVGNYNVTSTDLSNLIDSRFEKSRLYKKLVCEMGEIDFDEMSKSSILKKLTGQDLIGYEYKNKGTFDDVNYAKILISTNNMPQTLDKTDGFYRRWMIIDFPNSFTEEKDVIEDISEQEYENLCFKLVHILKVLLKIRKFSNEGSIEDRRKAYEEKSNPFDKFFNECVTLDYGKYSDESQVHIACWDLTKRFEEWCRINRYRIIPSSVVSKLMLERNIEKNRVTSLQYDKLGEKKQYWAWVGIRWKN